MTKDPFERYGTGSDYFLAGESEEKSLRSIEDRLRSRQAGKTSPVQWVIIAIVGFGLAILINEVWISHESGPMAEQYFEPLPVESIPHHGGEIVNDEAFAAYNSGDFEMAIATFETGDSKSVLDSFFLALSYEGAGHWDRALEILHKLDNRMPADWRSSVSWYRALAQVGTGDRDAAFVELELLKDGTSEYAPQARHLYDALQ